MKSIAAVLLVVVLYRTGASTPWVSALSLDDIPLEQCSECVLPLLQFKPADSSDISQLLQDDAKVDNFFRVADTAMSCLEECVDVKEIYLKDSITDAKDALQYLRKHVSVVRDNYKCLFSDVQIDVIQRCMGPAIASSASSVKYITCSEANKTYRCLRDQVCPPGSGSLQSSSAGGRLIAKLFQLSTKSMLKRSQGCAIDTSTFVTSTVDTRCASKVAKTDNVVMLLLISAVTSATFPIYLM